MSHFFTHATVAQISNIANVDGNSHGTIAT